MKNPYIPAGCDQQGRIMAPCRADFLTQPGEHLHASRDAMDRAQRATPIEGPFRHEDGGADHWLWWLAAAVLLCLVPAAPIIAEWVQ